MKYMNDWDLARAAQRFDRNVVPNRVHLVAVVDRLRQWTNANSDGWAYWPKPARAAAKAFALIESTPYPEYSRRELEDATDAEMKAALAPIKSFMTRHAHLMTDADRAWILGEDR